MKNQTMQAAEKYFSSFSGSKGEFLNAIRNIIMKAAPRADERISYGMPTYFLDGVLLHFGGYKHHVGIYPGPEAIKIFERDLMKFKTSKGAIQIPYDEKLPVTLLKKIIKHRISVNAAAVKVKLTKNT